MHRHTYVTRHRYVCDITCIDTPKYQTLIRKSLGYANFSKIYRQWYVCDIRYVHVYIHIYTYTHICIHAYRVPVYLTSHTLGQRNILCDRQRYMCDIRYRGTAMCVGVCIGCLYLFFSFVLMACISVFVCMCVCVYTCLSVLTLYVRIIHVCAYACVCVCVRVYVCV